MFYYLFLMVHFLKDVLINWLISVYTYVCAQVDLCVLAVWPEEGNGRPPLSISSYFFEAGSLGELGLELSQLGWQPGSPSDTPVSGPVGAGATSLCGTPALWRGGDLNASPCGHTVSTQQLSHLPNPMHLLLLAGKCPQSHHSCSLCPHAMLLFI